MLNRHWVPRTGNFWWDGAILKANNVIVKKLLSYTFSHVASLVLNGCHIQVTLYQTNSRLMNTHTHTHTSAQIYTHTTTHTHTHTHICVCVYVFIHLFTPPLSTCSVCDTSQFLAEFDWFEFSFPSPRSVVIAKLKTPVYFIIHPQMEKE